MIEMIRDPHKKNGGPLGARSTQHLANTLRHLLRFGAEPSRRWIETVPELKAPSQKQMRAEKRPRRAMSVAEREKVPERGVQVQADGHPQEGTAEVPAARHRRA